MKYTIYTDGACSGNPGPGGYAAVIVICGKIYLAIKGGKKETTNNQMELMAIVRGLKHLIKDPMLKGGEIIVKSDSAYCINSINNYYVNCWMKNGWKTKNGCSVKNLELWKELMDLKENNKKKWKIKFEKVPGHSGIYFNEVVDKMAKEAIEKVR